VLSGGGYVPGVGAESTDVPDLTYTTKSINSLYANYYNITGFSIASHIEFNDGESIFTFGLPNYGYPPKIYVWQIQLVDPNGATVSSWDSSGATCALGTCELYISRTYQPPAGGWIAGNWYAKLYEHKIDTSILTPAPLGNLALLTTSATWHVFNASESANGTGTINPPTESINSPSNINAISLIDGFVGLLGLGVNSVSKLLFALIVITLIGGFALLISKRGDIAALFMFAPYIFMTYIEYVPKWVFIIVIIMLAIASKVFR
jgi:hypothetical protein